VTASNLCPRCFAPLGEGKRQTYPYPGLPQVEIRDVEMFQCARCGEQVVRFENMIELHREIAAGIIQKAASLTGREVRFLRQLIGQTGAQFAATMGVDRSTVSRWENDALAIGQQSDRLLRSLAVHKLDAEPSDDVKLDLLELLPRTATEAPRPTSLHLAAENGRWRRVA
jgi:putative zinc finger/helix-turn-helix YgiT family protein